MNNRNKGRVKNGSASIILRVMLTAINPNSLKFIDIEALSQRGFLFQILMLSCYILYKAFNQKITEYPV